MADALSLSPPGPSRSLAEYFRELVRKSLRFQAPEAIEFYLVNLLTQSVTTAEVYGTPPEGFREEPLAFLYLRAVNADASLQIKLLKRLGDFSLFISGFFPESLSRRPVDVGYYIQMGENAYGNLSNLVARKSAFAEIFSELASRFIAYSDVLSEVSEQASVSRDTDLLRLYERWLKTGSRRAAEILAAEGIQPVAPFSPSPKFPN
jgi:hypothetical protein